MVKRPRHLRPLLRLIYIDQENTRSEILSTAYDRKSAKQYENQRASIRRGSSLEANAEAKAKAKPEPKPKPEAEAKAKSKAEAT